MAEETQTAFAERLVVAARRYVPYPARHAHFTAFLEAEVKAHGADFVRAQIASVGVDVNGDTLLAYFAKQNHTALLIYCIQNIRADPNTVDERGNSLLMIATNRGNWPLAELLVAYGADVGVRNRVTGATPLIYACKCNAVALIDALTRETHAYINQPASRADLKNTPLLVAARYASADAVLLLLQRGADVEYANTLGVNVAGCAFLNTQHRAFYALFMVLANDYARVRRLVEHRDTQRRPMYLYARGASLQFLLHTLPEVGRKLFPATPVNAARPETPTSIVRELVRGYQYVDLFMLLRVARATRVFDTDAQREALATDVAVALALDARPTVHQTTDVLATLAVLLGATETRSTAAHAIEHFYTPELADDDGSLFSTLPTTGLDDREVAWLRALVHPDTEMEVALKEVPPDFLQLPGFSWPVSQTEPSIQWIRLSATTYAARYAAIYTCLLLYAHLRRIVTACVTPDVGVYEGLLYEHALACAAHEVYVTRLPRSYLRALSHHIVVDYVNALLNDGVRSVGGGTLPAAAALLHALAHPFADAAVSEVFMGYEIFEFAQNK